MRSRHGGENVARVGASNGKYLALASSIFFPICCYFFGYCTTFINNNNNGSVLFFLGGENADGDDS